MAKRARSLAVKQVAIKIDTMVSIDINHSGLISAVCTMIAGGGTALLAFWRLLRALLGTNSRITLNGKHCFVTGGSSGIGKEVAKQMVLEGGHITIAARKQATLDDTMVELEACRISPDQMIQSVSVDVGDPAAVEKATADAVAKQGTVQILANCAGFAIAREMEETSVADMERILRVNTLGTAYVTRALLSDMKAAGSGRILFTSSVVGQIGVYGYTAYAASKFALVGMAQALQMEVKAYGIGVCVAYPPDTDTPGYARESVGKPESTRLIEEGGGMFSPAQVAAKIVQGLKAGDFCITVGLEGFFVGLGTAGFSPCFSVFDATFQVALSSVLRAAAFLFNNKFYSIAAREKRKRDAEHAPR